MAFELRRPFPFFSLGSIILLSVTAAGCAVDASSPEDGDAIEASTDAITEIDQTVVKRQSIGNCWLYATASWAESLHKSATGNDKNFSESYWTYWHWFDQIANGGSGSEISTGGSYYTAAEIINRYGAMFEGEFIAGEINAEMSNRQATALSAINRSLESGALKSSSARRDRALVRRELDKAWGLETSVVKSLDKVFGTRVNRTLDRSASTSGTSVLAAKDIEVRFHKPRDGRDVDATLQDAIGKRSGWRRTGPLAWNEVNYPWDPSSRRAFQKRFQRALHDGAPVIMSWFVDFNAMAPGGKFVAPPSTPGSQGGHMVVMHDYEVTNVPGFGTLKAGVLETRRAALEAALSDEAEISFIRIKNSWGNVRTDRNFTSGYHDLYMKYLNGPVQQCSEDDEGHTDPTNCWDTTPFNDVVLPPGY